MAYLSLTEGARRAGVHTDRVRKLVKAGIIQRYRVPGYLYPVIRESDVATIRRECPARYLPPVEVVIGVPFRDPTPQEIRERCRVIREAALQRIPDPRTTHYADTPKPPAIPSADAILRRFRERAVRHVRRRSRRQLRIAG
ncbi:hypothetical protein Enr13x_12650 [Stieleria neptunia]|uniref:Helix-turn-helix domain protein n=1 Tax=Stieleria neptunia TaxID=2527979 RepID=A0A518HKQ1_9BACT|nr:hypothetical protein [Stieleria neptunia]QDV41426.1 hypothetical protein Enr13x_12650 [Stieleria neptunia]